MSVCGSVKIQMGSVPIFAGAGASPLKSIETKFSINAPVPANAPANAQWKQSLITGQYTENWHCQHVKQRSTGFATMFVRRQQFTIVMMYVNILLWAEI